MTSDSLQKVLSPTFLDRFSTSGLRKFDRIEVNADCLGAGERATLLVEENLEGQGEGEATMKLAPCGW